MFKGFLLELTSIQKSPRLPRRPMEIDHSSRTYPIPIPMGIPVGVPIPTAALRIGLTYGSKAIVSINELK